jgi:hypothetical protein
MYLALFLAPWTAIYALSTLVMNHTPFTGAKPRTFTLERELSYTNPVPVGASERDVARKVLQELGLDGPFNMQGSLKQGRLTILRLKPLATRRLIFFASENRLTVEKEDFQMAQFLRGMHTRSGFDQPYAAAKSWGLLVDLVVVAMVFWVASGVWMWWEIKPARRLGGLLAVAGFALYTVLVCLL